MFRETRKFLTIPVLLGWALLLTSCASWGRQCTGCMAESFGADWVITQNDMQGKPYRCWKLTNVSVDNEPGSDGVQWKSPDGHMVHIAGQYNRVQVTNGRWDSAFSELGITEDSCTKVRERRFDPVTNTYHLTSEVVYVPTRPAQPLAEPQPSVDTAVPHAL